MEIKIQRFLASSLLIGALLVPTATAFATEGLDDLRGPSSQEQGTQNNQNGSVPIEEFLKERTETNENNNRPNINTPVEEGVGEGSFELPESNPGDVGDFIKGYTPVTSDSLQEANRYLQGPMKWVSYIISGGILLLTGAIFLVTILDLVYITLPFTRSFLYTPSTTGTGSPIGGGMMGSPAMGGSGSLMGVQWVSDEAVRATAVNGGESPAQGVHMQQMGGMYGMNSPAMTPMQARRQSRGSVIGSYFMSRVKFMIALGVAVVLLFSSIFLDFGINVGGMIVTFITENLL